MKHLPVNKTAWWRHGAALSVKRKQTYQITALHITSLLSRYHNTDIPVCCPELGIWSERVHAKQWFSETQRYVLLYLGNIPTRCACVGGFAWPKALTPVERCTANIVYATNQAACFHYSLEQASINVFLSSFCNTFSMQLCYKYGMNHCWKALLGKSCTEEIFMPSVKTHVLYIFNANSSFANGMEMEYHYIPSL